MHAASWEGLTSPCGTLSARYHRPAAGHPISGALSAGDRHRQENGPPACRGFDSGPGRAYQYVASQAIRSAAGSHGAGRQVRQDDGPPGGSPGCLLRAPQQGRAPCSARLPRCDRDPLGRDQMALRLMPSLRRSAIFSCPPAGAHHRHAPGRPGRPWQAPDSPTKPAQRLTHRRRLTEAPVFPISSNLSFAPIV